jgi:predicted YcjX-like family ATPase
MLYRPKFGPDFVQRTKQKLKGVTARILDQQINLAVTGLSGSGKTAFVTSLVNQLLEANEQAHLPFFSVVAESRLVGVKRDMQPNLNCSRFAYEEAIKQLSQQPPVWPASTSGVSQVRLKIRYRPAKGLNHFFTENINLTLDITDYPGEWLLDLPLLDMDFQQWIEHCQSELQQVNRQPLAEPFMLALNGLDLRAAGDELELQNIAQLYSQYLQNCRAKGVQLIQPGRFILPGELSGAPVLHFFPVLAAQIKEQKVDLLDPPKGSNIDLLIGRFNHYKEQVVKPFYKDHFKAFDRQVVLVDCLSALNQGYDSYQDLQSALDWVMRSFDYGRGNILNRLFKPKIDKLAFAASKADHITPDQQTNLVKLLDSMLHSARKKIQFEGVISQSTAVAAIRASKSALSSQNGQSIPVLSAIDKQGQPITLYPGDVPERLPSREFWLKQGFEFPHFAPPLLQGDHALPHIRMDQLLDFLLADKLL